MRMSEYRKVSNYLDCKITSIVEDLYRSVLLTCNMCSSDVVVGSIIYSVITTPSEVVCHCQLQEVFNIIDARLVSSWNSKSTVSSKHLANCYLSDHFCIGVDRICSICITICKWFTTRSSEWFLEIVKCASSTSLTVRSRTTKIYNKSLIIKDVINVICSINSAVTRTCNSNLSCSSSITREQVMTSLDQEGCLTSSNTPRCNWTSNSFSLC